MKKDLSQTVEIPSGVEAELIENLVKVKGKEGTNERKFDFSKLSAEKKDNQIIIGNKKATKKEKRRMNTIAAHIRNMIKGVQEKFEYKLKVCFSHFPITVEVKGNEVSIKNFLGEKVPRKIGLPKEVEVEVEKDIITVKSTDKELAGMVSANLENVTRISNRDRRIFQDGIFITNKCGEEM